MIKVYYYLQTNLSLISKIKILTLKKIIHILFPLILIVITTFSCNTGQLSLSQSNIFNVSVKDNLFIFQTLNDYKTVVNDPSEEIRADFLRTVSTFKSFTSLAKNENELSADIRDTLIRDSYFKSFLNTDFAVQIENYIFKINPISKKVFALHSKYSNQYQDLLSENVKNVNVKQFSFDDNILEIINVSEITPKKASFCLQSGIGERHISSQFIFGSTKILFLDYNKYGIYNSLVASIYPQGSWPSPYTFEFTGGVNLGDVYYHVRCGYTADYQTTSVGSWALSKQKYQSYQGSTNLNELYFGCRVKNTSTNQYETGYINIRVNH